MGEMIFEKNEPSSAIASNFPPFLEDTSDNITNNEVREKEEVDPNRRAGQKKQGREVKKKARLNDGWQERNNKRGGRPKLPMHTPSKKGHKKYFSYMKPIKIFGV